MQILLAFSILQVASLTKISLATWNFPWKVELAASLISMSYNLSCLR